MDYHVRKELLSERDGNLSLTTVGTVKIDNRSGRNFSLKEMETCSSEVLLRF